MIDIVCKQSYDSFMNTSVIHWPRSVHPAMEHITEKSEAKNNGYVRIRISLPGRPRTTGEKSQNRHINGHIQQIAIETGNDFEVVKMAIKSAAISEGYGFQTLPDGSVWPISESEATIEQAAVLIETIHRFAMEWGIILKEDDNDI